MSEGGGSNLKEFKLDFDHEGDLEEILDSREIEPNRRRLPSNPDDIFGDSSPPGSSLLGFHSTPSDHSGRRRDIQLQRMTKGSEEKPRMGQVAPLSQMLTFLRNSASSKSPLERADINIETSTGSSVVEPRISMHQDSLLGPAPAVVDELASSEPGVRSKRNSFFRHKRPKSFGKRATREEAMSKSQSRGNECDKSIKREEGEQQEGNSSSEILSRSSALWKILKKATLSQNRKNRSVQKQDKETLVSFFLGEGGADDKKGACMNDTEKKEELSLSEMENGSGSTPSAPNSGGLGLRGKFRKHFTAANERLQGIQKFDATTFAFFGIEGDSNQEEEDSVEKKELEWYNPFPTNTIDIKTLEKSGPLPKSILKVKTSDLGGRARWDLDAVLHPPNAPSPSRPLRDSDTPAPGPGLMSVKFSNVEIREYVRIVGDNPSTSLGPPMALGWSYRHIYENSLDHYESSRPYRKTKLSLQMDAVARQLLLTREWNATATELLEARQEIDVIRTQRMETVEECRDSCKAALLKLNSSLEKKEVQPCVPSSAQEV